MKTLFRINIKIKLCLLIVFCFAYMFTSFAALVSISGNWSYQYSGSNVVITVNKISNLSSSGTSGSLQLELWAFGSPYDGGQQLGYRLADYQLNTLSAGFFYSNVSVSTPGTRPPPGTWYLALLVTEWNGSTWITRDYALTFEGQTMVCTASVCNSISTEAGAASISISTNRPSFSVGSPDNLILSATINAGTSTGILSDIYVGVSFDLGSTFYLSSTLEWVSTLTPAAINFPIVDVNAPDFYTIPIDGLPEGNFQFSLSLNRAGTDASNTNNRIAYGASTAQFSLMSDSCGDIVFNPRAFKTTPKVGEFFSHNFYRDVDCGLAPYYFTLGTLGGFPPFGLILAPNGVLSGIPETVQNSVKFTVCAVDLGGNQSCREQELRVNEQDDDDENPNPDPNPNPNPGNYFYANWTCGTSSSCAGIMGGTQGSIGLFCSIDDCSTWANNFIPAGFSCGVTPTFSPVTDDSPKANGMCSISGVDF